MAIEYGAAQPARVQCFKELSERPNSSVATHQLTFGGSLRTLPIWKVPLALPKYRLLNGRTASAQREWLAGNPNAGSDFFARDPESLEAQKVQHHLLEKYINEEGLLKYFKDAEHEQEGVLILDSNGFVINGNRRLCSWRILYDGEAAKYAHLATVSVVVLPPADPREIDKLEGRLQVAPEMRAEYEWHSLANMMKDRRSLHGLSVDQLADFYNMSASEVKRLIDKVDYGAAYLQARGVPHQWSKLTKKEFAFDKLVDLRTRVGNGGAKKLFETAAYALIDDPAGGRLYEAIPAMQKYMDKVRDQLLVEFPISAEEIISDPRDPLGDDPAEAKNYVLASKVNADAASRERLVNIVREVIDTQKAFERDAGAANFVLKRLQQAAAGVQSAIAGYKPDQANLEGVDAAMATIEEALSKLRQAIAGHASH